MTLVDMGGEETPNQSTVGISCHFVSEECFKNNNSEILWLVLKIIASFQIY